MLVFLVAGQSNAGSLDRPVLERLRRRLSETVAVVHVAEGGTPLVNAPYCRPSWHPDRRGEKFDQLLAAVRAKYDEICAQGGEPVGAGLFWMQGEQDSKTDNRGPGGTSLPPPPQPLAAQSYEANLRLLIHRIREALRCAALPVVLGDTPLGAPPDYALSASKHAATPVVVAAQAAVARSEPKVALVPTVGLERGPDRVHLTPQGLEALAEAMVAAWFAMR